MNHGGGESNDEADMPERVSRGVCEKEEEEKRGER